MVLESQRARELLARAGLGDCAPAKLRALVVAAALLVAVGLWRFWPRAPAPEMPVDREAEAAAQTESEPAAVVVHVAGAVMRPGVYTLPTGSRVADAISAAGGALGAAAPHAINLARILADGEQVYVPTASEVESGLAPSQAQGGVPGTAGALVNLNTADAAALDALPGIGPATAEKIVQDRETNGPFARPEDLMRVPGIGQKKYDALKDLVTTG